LVQSAFCATGAKRSQFPEGPTGAEGVTKTYVEDPESTLMGLGVVAAAGLPVALSAVKSSTCAMVFPLPSDAFHDRVWAFRAKPGKTTSDRSNNIDRRVMVQNPLQV